MAEKRSIAVIEDSSIESQALLGSAKELLIKHGDEIYRLRITANNKLILTK